MANTISLIAQPSASILFSQLYELVVRECGFFSLTHFKVNFVPNYYLYKVSLHIISKDNFKFVFYLFLHEGIQNIQNEGIKLVLFKKEIICPKLIKLWFMIEWKLQRATEKRKENFNS